ncbi:hypothetical protein J5X84_35500 [Streptosporangiaceae bacterium NEAU-GS5]|nr:hypothetical protein [Streptosporangiaceae bacterium NEAU-GS5]
MNTRITALATVAAAAIAAGQLAVAAPAAALPGRTLAFGNSALDASNTKVARAFCPDGTVVVGGGAALQGVGSDVIKFRTLTPFLHGTDSYGYEAIALEIRPVASDWSIAARAICAPKPAGYQVKDVRIASGSEPVKTASATCDNGRRALAAGGTVRGPSLATTQITLRGALVDNAHTGGYAIGEETTGGFSGTWDMIATVVCANEPAGYTVINKDVPAPSGTTDVAAQATCPGTTKVHGTEALIIPGTAGDVHLYFASSVEPNQSLIRSHTSTPGQTPSWQLRAQAVCAN